VKSIVKSVKPSGGFKNDHGEFFTFEVLFENGDGGQYTSKSENQIKFVAGQEAEYEIEQSKYGFKIKPVQPQQGAFKGQKSGGYQREPFSEMCIGHAMGYAKDLVVAGIGSFEELPSIFSRIYGTMMRAGKGDLPIEKGEEKVMAAKTISSPQAAPKKDPIEMIDKVFNDYPTQMDIDGLTEDLKRFDWDNSTVPKKEAQEHFIKCQKAWKETLENEKGFEDKL